MLKTSIFSYWAKSSCVNTINLVVSHIKCTADISYYYEKYESESHSIASSSLWSHGRWNSPGQNTLVGSLSLLQGIFPTQGSNPGHLHCRWILYQLSPQGQPKNSGADSLSLCQWIFLTQESNWGLLHCRQIHYQLSYEGSPKLELSEVRYEPMPPGGLWPECSLLDKLVILTS